MINFKKINIGLIFLIAAALILLFDLYQDINTNYNGKRLTHEFFVTVKKNKKESIKTNKIVIDDKEYVGIIEVPKIGVSLVVNKTLDNNNLKKTPCVYNGNINDGNFIIAAHNSYSHFGELYKLEIGDEVNFTDTEGKVYKYKVEKQEQLENNQVDEMLNTDYDLTLFTCTPGGKYRVTIRCNLIEK